MMDAADKVFEVLVRTIRAKRPELLRGSFTVGELYQQILPFRHYRRELGMETNQEYEHALMQLLTGDRGFVDVDDRLRDQLKRELALPSPDPARVRDFADAQVTINRAAEARVSKPQQDGRGSQASRSSGIVRSPSLQDAPRCRYCGGVLPEGRELNFCPHCGQNLKLLNCPGCGAEIELEWKYCVACGKSVPESLRKE